MSNRQVRFDGGSVDGEIFNLRIEAIRTFDIGYAEATKLIPTDADAATWHRLLGVPLIEDVDYRKLIDPAHHTAILWTAEVAGQPGSRATDLALVHIQLDGEIETFFKRDKYAVETFDQFPDDLAERDDEFYLLNEAGNPGDMVLEWYNGGNGYFFDQWGDKCPGDYYNWVGDDEIFRVLDPENHPVDVMHHNMMYEHIDPITIATHNDVFKFGSRGGVMWDREYYSDAPEWAWDAAVDNYNGDLSWHRVSTGWHSSMERSELSNMINDITSGDLPPEVDGPVMVKFSGTGNVCSVGISVYAEHEADADILKEYLSGARAAPGYAGVR